MQPAVAARQNVGFFGVPWWVVMIACVVYVLSPIDFIPEFPLGCIGLVDDVGAIAFGIFALVRMLSGGGAMPAPASATAGPEPRTVTVETRANVPVLAPRLPPHVIVPERAASTAPLGVFVVQVVDDEGGDRRIEVQARDAEHARGIVRAAGADGSVGKVWLKRFIDSAESVVIEGVSDAR